MGTGKWVGKVGILTRSDLLTAITGRGSQTHVADVMRRQFETVDPSEMLELAFARLQRLNATHYPWSRPGS
ncbi:MAG: hypothetical protein WKF77_08305 [Planctomycetaceae bacterium]